MFPVCSLIRTAGSTIDNRFAGVDCSLPEPVLWLADDWLAKVRAGTELLAVGAKDKTPLGPVALLQRAVRYWGCSEKKPAQLLLPAFGVDGDYGDETRDAVIQFQRENRDAEGNPLEPDGMVGRLTMGALDQMVVPPIRPPKSDMLTVWVDVVIFPDGHGPERLPRILHEANYVFNRAGIRIELGTVWGPDVTAHRACQIFEESRGRPSKRGCKSIIQRQTVDGVTPELRRLAAFRPGASNRITVYHVGPFPPGSTTPWGATFTPFGSDSFFVVLIPNTATADPVDIWWHELGHCLLNTAPGDVVDGKSHDHAHDFMGVHPFPGLGKASYPIPRAVVRRMQQTALLDLA